VAVQKADELYGLPLERFVPERQALARELRTGGRREQAAEVASLRKPSVAAWAVNQLVRTQRKAVAELFEAGDQAARAQSELIAGQGDGQSLREATRRQRAAVEALLDAAGGLLSSEGHELSAATLERVADTLNAAALDEEARPPVREGRLERELRHVGLVMAPGAAPASNKGRKSERAAKAEKPTPERKQERRAARAAEHTAKRVLGRAERALKAAEERRDRAAQALEEAEQALAEAREKAEAAKRA